MKLILKKSIPIDGIIDIWINNFWSALESYDIGCLLLMSINDRVFVSTLYTGKVFTCLPAKIAVRTESM